MMPSLLVALAILGAIVYGPRLLARANPAQVRQWTKQAGGLLAVAAALFLLTRGQFEVALGVGGLGAYLLGWSVAPNFGPYQWLAGLTGRRQGETTARTRFIEWRLAAQSVAGGRVIDGPFAGADLDALGPKACDELLALCRAEDPDGAQLLQVYLDRRFAGRGAAGQRDGDARRENPRRPGSLTEKEAYETLGLAATATRDDIVRAHRMLMKKLHPDYGGSTGLAARVNEAKDVLLRRHS